MENKSKSLPRGWRTTDIQKVVEFVRMSDGIPQLAHARVHGILLLSNLTSDSFGWANVPELNASEVEILLRSSERYVANGDLRELQAA
jgi:hypothetical protein